MITEYAAVQWDLEPDDLFLSVGHHFGRVEPRRRMRDYVCGLLAQWPEGTAGNRPSKPATPPLTVCSTCSSVRSGSRNSTTRGRVLADRELYLPKSWTDVVAHGRPASGGGG